MVVQVQHAGGMLRREDFTEEQATLDGKVFAEVDALARVRGGRPETFAGLAGTGDLVATVVSEVLQVTVVSGCVEPSV